MSRMHRPDDPHVPESEPFGAQETDCPACGSTVPVAHLPNHLGSEECRGRDD